MKKRLLLGLAPAVLLLFSCGGNNKTTTAITKINLSGAKTLVMGTLKSSTNEDSETSDTDGTLISIDENNEASETSVVVSDGTSTTQVASIEITKLVKLNKIYAVISAIYNNETYDLIVNLKDGTCVKFPDSNMLPNSKQKLGGAGKGGHKSYRKYIQKFGYLNRNIVQPDEYKQIFYYVNHFDVTLEDGTTKEVRRLIKLDLDTNKDNPTSTVLVVPEENRSIQSFAVNQEGCVAYYTSAEAKITDNEKLKGPYVFSNNKKCLVTNNYDADFYPILYTGSDGVIYCYLSKDNKYYMAHIDITESEETITAEAVKNNDDSSGVSEAPKKIFNIKQLYDGKGTEVINTISITDGSNDFAGKISELFGFNKEKKEEITRRISNFDKPGKWGRDDKKTEHDIDTKTLTDTLTIEDGFEGNKFGYVFGKNKIDGKKQLKIIKCKADKLYDLYDFTSILENYFGSLTKDVEVTEIEADSNEEESSENAESATIIVEDETTNNTEDVVVVDENGEEEVVDEIATASEVVDVND